MGWEWLSVSAFAVVFLWQSPKWSAIGLSLCWLALYVDTGDRRIFFPFTIQLAAQVAIAGLATSPGRATVNALAMLTLFSAIRLAQSASLIVLTVEVVVAVVALAITFAIVRANWAGRTVAAALASLLAFAGIHVA